LNEYIVDADISLHSIVYVRDAITKSRAIEFDLLPYEAQLHHTDGASVDDSPAGEQSFCSIEADEGLGFDLSTSTQPGAQGICSVSCVGRVCRVCVSCACRVATNQCLQLYKTVFMCTT
jgi:hypothetical protein